MVHPVLAAVRFMPRGRTACILAIGLALVLLASGHVSPSARAEDEKKADPLPLLPPGLHVGLIYADEGTKAKRVYDLAFKQCLGTGLKAQGLSIAWDELEPAPGKFETQKLRHWLAICQIVGVRPYLALQTLDTNNLRLPVDLEDPDDSLRLRPGLAFDDPVVVKRFARLLEVVVPLLVKRGCFFLSVGNEVDLFPLDRKGEKAFLGFLDAAREKVRVLAPKLGVGATITFGGLSNKPAFDAEIIRRSDAMAITWYPLDAAMRVRDPSVAASDLDAMKRAAGDKSILLQEVGYPAGWEPKAGNASSPEAQAAFVRNVFAALGSHPEIRFLSWFMLNDFSRETVARLEAYYRIDAGRFGEFLGTLGFRRADGTARPAYDAFLEGMRQLSSQPEAATR